MQGRLALEIDPLNLVNKILYAGVLIWTGDCKTALDLAEEDLALVTALAPGGHDFGAYLRRMLDRVAGEGGA